MSTVKLKDLKANPKNPRTMSDAKLKMLTKSLAEFGDLGCIVFNKRTGHITGGHQRLKSLPGDAEIIMDTETYGHVEINGDRFGYRVVDWDETKEKAANIAANKHGGEWDLAQLSEWLTELDQFGVDFELTGFSHEEAVQLFAPEFVPGNLEEQGKLDEKKKVHCPNCGEDFVP